MQLISSHFNYWLLLIPALTAFAGWLVIRLFLFFLFKPALPKNFLGFTVQGILPKNQSQLASAAGQFAAGSFSIDQLQEKIKDPRNFDQVRPIIESHIDDFLRNKLKEQMPMIGMFIGDKTIQSLKTIFIKEIEELFPEVMHQFSGNLQKELNIQAMVTEKLARVSPQMIADEVNKKTQPIALMGGLIGLLIGIIQLGILWFI